MIVPTATGTQGFASLRSISYLAICHRSRDTRSGIVDYGEPKGEFLYAYPFYCSGRSYDFQLPFEGL
jgi:hypothetical protein